MSMRMSTTNLAGAGGLAALGAILAYIQRYTAALSWTPYQSKE